MWVVIAMHVVVGFISTHAISGMSSRKLQIRFPHMARNLSEKVCQVPGQDSGLLLVLSFSPSIKLKYC